jgi:phospholipase C
MLGAWLQQQVVNAVMNSPAWNETALIINYDESGGRYHMPLLQLSMTKLTESHHNIGFYDHVVPPQAPSSEYVTDKWTGKQVPIGFGPRVPLVCVSPYCRGGNVFTEVADHTATILLLEEWIGQYSNGTYKAPAGLISPWHRNVTSNLLNLFDFNNPDFSIPTLPTMAKPATNSAGVWDPTEMCEA